MKYPLAWSHLRWTVRRHGKVPFPGTGDLPHRLDTGDDADGSGSVDPKMTLDHLHAARFGRCFSAGMPPDPVVPELWKE
jgi:hypothetical protein